MKITVKCDVTSCSPVFSIFSEISAASIFRVESTLYGNSGQWCKTRTRSSLVHAKLQSLSSNITDSDYSSTLKMVTGTLSETPVHICQAMRVISHEISTGLRLRLMTERKQNQDKRTKFRDITLFRGTTLWIYHGIRLCVPDLVLTVLHIWCNNGTI